MKISTELRRAATWLEPNDDADRQQKDLVTYICHAICKAKYGERWHEHWDSDKVDRWASVRFLEELGMPLGGSGFLRIEPKDVALSDSQIQGARFMWLMLCADLAEEQGL